MAKKRIPTMHIHSYPLFQSAGDSPLLNNPPHVTSLARFFSEEKKAIYAFQLKHHTTTDLTAEQIHDIGHKEVAKIKDHMTLSKEKLNFSGDLGQFWNHIRLDTSHTPSSGAVMIARYEDAHTQVLPKLPGLFPDLPKAPLDIVETQEDQNHVAAYHRPTKGHARGTFKANSNNLSAHPGFSVNSLYLHEGMPGHHLQIALAQDNKLSQGPTVYVEGWALYAETLGYEMGLYKDPLQEYGHLSLAMLRAQRLVVDTGLHALDWTREQAIDYMHNNGSQTKDTITTEVDRYRQWPGQATAYLIGKLAITGWREEAEAKLGPDFSLKAFHGELLSDGGMALKPLHVKMTRWIADQQKKTPDEKIPGGPLR